MAEYIVCPSCNRNDIGIYSEKFRKLADEEIKKDIKKRFPNILPKNYSKISGMDVATDDIFDKLGVDNMCCRMRILTHYPNISESEK